MRKPWVIGSTDTVDARTNTGTTPSTAGGSLGVPIYNLAGQIVASSNDDFWDSSLQNPIGFTETGAGFVSGTTVWTGTTGPGLDSTGSELGGLVIVKGKPRRRTRTGLSSLIDGRWIERFILDNSTSNSFYAMSDILTVSSSSSSTPEPGTFALASMIAGLVGLGYRRRRRGHVDGENADASPDQPAPDPS